MSDQYINCEKETIVHQLVKVEAEVEVKPHVKHGKPKVCFLDTEIEQDCKREKCKDDCYPKGRESDKCDEKCTFTVTQVLCIEIPISFDVDVDVDKGSIDCCKPQLGPCRPPCKEPHGIG